MDIACVDERLLEYLALKQVRRTCFDHSEFHSDTSHDVQPVPEREHNSLLCGPYEVSFVVDIEIDA